MAVTVLQKKKR